MVQFVRGSNLPRVKVTNRSAILRMIYHYGPIKRSDIAQVLGLTMPTITTSVSDMIADGIVEETLHMESVSDGPGRKARLVDIVPESRHFVGVEIQGYRRALCVLDFRGRTLHAEVDSQPLDGYEENLERVRAMFERALKKTGLTPPEIDGVGVCVPGLVDRAKGVLDTLPSYKWSNRDIRKDMAALIGYAGPISVENNACARAYGARLFQWNKLSGAWSFAYLLVSRGIACPLVLNSGEISGSVVGAGEIGHMIMEPDGLPCSCGNRGCLEAYSSDTAVTARCAEALSRGWAPILRRLAADPARPTMGEIVAAQSQGDEDVAAIVREALDRLGVALANINNFACPQIVVIDGALFRWEENRRYLLEVNHRNLCNVIHTDTEYLFVDPDETSGARGAAARAIGEHMEPSIQ